jgi:hypothetical protein
MGNNKETRVKRASPTRATAITAAKGRVETNMGAEGPMPPEPHRL